MYLFYIDSGNLTWDVIHKCDEIGGYIEQVADNLIVWHSLKWRQVARAVRFVRNTWGITVPRDGIYEMHVHGSFDTPVRVIARKPSAYKADNGNALTI